LTVLVRALHSGVLQVSGERPINRRMVGPRQNVPFLFLFTSAELAENPAAKSTSREVISCLIGAGTLSSGTDLLGRARAIPTHSLCRAAHSVDSVPFQPAASATISFPSSSGISFFFASVTIRTGTPYHRASPCFSWRNCNRLPGSIAVSHSFPRSKSASPSPTREDTRWPC